MAVDVLLWAALIGTSILLWAALIFGETYFQNSWWIYLPGLPHTLPRLPTTGESDKSDTMFPFKTVNDGRRLHVDPSADPVVDPAFQRCPDHPQCQHRASTLCPFAHNVGVSRRNEDMVRAFYAAELEKQHGKHAGVEDRVPDVDSLSAAKKMAVVEASSASSASASLASSSSSSTNKRKTADNRLEKVEANKSEAVSAENRQEVEHGISSKAKRQRHVTANPALQQANANATTQSATLELREPRATKIAIKLRRATLTAIGKLFTEMYASIADTEKNAAIIDAIRQEWELHEASTSRSYQSNAASVLVALRKRMREAATGESDAVAIRGTMGQYERALEERRLQQESGRSNDICVLSQFALLYALSLSLSRFRLPAGCTSSTQAHAKPAHRTRLSAPT